MRVKIFWDEPKRLANLRKHGIDFAEADAFGWASAVIRPARMGRYRAVGFLESKLICIIFAPLGSEGVSVISMRSASASERRLHEQTKGLH